MGERMLRGSRLGAVSYESDRNTELAPRQTREYLCAKGHQFEVPFAVDAEVPDRPGSASSTAASRGWSTATSRSRRRPSRRVPTGTCCWSGAPSPSWRTSSTSAWRRSAPAAAALTPAREHERRRPRDVLRRAPSCLEPSCRCGRQRRGSMISPSMARARPGRPAPPCSAAAGRRRPVVCRRAARPGAPVPAGARTGPRRPSTTSAARWRAAPRRGPPARSGGISSSSPITPVTTAGHRQQQARAQPDQPVGRPARPGGVPASAAARKRRQARIPSRRSTSRPASERGEDQQDRRAVADRPAQHHEDDDLDQRGQRQRGRYALHCASHVTPFGCRRVLQA